MAGKNKNKNKTTSSVVAQNRRARHDYFIDDTFEAGMQLFGTEVKSLRQGQVSINESHAGEKNGAIYLFNALISEYSQCSPKFQHDPKRPRKLLLHKREIDRLLGAVQKKGVTLVPLKIYFSEKGLAKLLLGVGRGKKQHDKRETEKQRDWDRQKQRVLSDHS